MVGEGFNQQLSGGSVLDQQELEQKAQGQQGITQPAFGQQMTNQQNFDRQAFVRQGRATSKIRTLGIISLVLGALITLAWLPVGPWAGPAGIMAMALAFPAVIIEVICFILLDICIYIKKRNGLVGGGLLAMPIIGFLLSCSLWIFAAMIGMF